MDGQKPKIKFLGLGWAKIKDQIIEPAWGQPGPVRNFIKNFPVYTYITYPNPALPLCGVECGLLSCVVLVGFYLLVVGREDPRD